MSAKDLLVRPVSSAEAGALVRRVHYSGKVTQNSQLHFGVFWRGRLEGAVQLGPSIDLRRMAGTVQGSGIHDFMELNRMAFTDRLPPNSESRALGIVFRLMRRHAPQIRWVVTFADATQCGDGTIYRACGFDLIGIKRNASLLRLPDGRVVAKKALDNTRMADGRYASAAAIESGATPLVGFQIKYIKFLDPLWADRLAVPRLPYAALDAAGARMYRGRKICAGSITADAPADQAGEGGSIPTPALQSLEAD